MPKITKTVESDPYDISGGRLQEYYYETVMALARTKSDSAVARLMNALRYSEGSIICVYVPEGVTSSYADRHAAILAKFKEVKEETHSGLQEAKAQELIEAIVDFSYDLTDDLTTLISPQKK
jgi:hypothetical protein